MFEIKTTAESSARSVITLRRLRELLCLRFPRPVTGRANLRQVPEAGEPGHRAAGSGASLSTVVGRAAARVAQPEGEVVVAALAAQRFDTVAGGA